MLDHAAYDPASGQVVAASLMDYALPRAGDLPSYDLGFNGTRCTTNPLGVKGSGEAGAVGAFPEVTNAILDALSPLAATNLAGPATPEADLAGDPRRKCLLKSEALHNLGCLSMWFARWCGLITRPTIKRG